MKIRTPYLIIFILFVTLGAYYPAIFSPVNTVDDKGMALWLLNNDNFTIKGLFVPGGSGYYYRPLLVATFLADKYLWNLQESFMHLENMLFHALNAVLVFLIAVRIFSRYGLDNRLLPLVAALLFALHPINTEPVNWISGRTDLLAGLFILTSILLLLHALERNSSLLACAASFSLLLATFAKDTAVFVYPAALYLVYSYDQTGRVANIKAALTRIKQRMAFYCVISFAVLLYFGFRRLAFSQGDSGISTATSGLIGEKADILYNLRVGIKLLGFYGKKLFIPWPLNFAIVDAADYYVYVGVLILMVLVYLVYRVELLASLFLTSACLIAPAFLVALSRMAWTPIAERYLYIPSATFSIAITFLVYRLFQKFRTEKLLIAVTPLLLSGAAYATVDRNMAWQDNLTLFQDTVRKSPDFPPARNELAVALMEHGMKEQGHEIIKSNKIDKKLKNKEYGIENMAAVRAAEGDLEGARQFLLASLDEKEKNYPILLKKLIEIDDKRLRQTSDPQKLQEINKELCELLKKMYGRTSDTFYCYRLGQSYLSMNNRSEAQKMFALVYEKAADSAYYKLPAKRLAEKLRQ